MERPQQHSYSRVKKKQWAQARSAWFCENNILFFHYFGAIVTSVLQFIPSGGGHIMEKHIFHHSENPPQIAKSISSHNNIEVYGAH